MHEGEPPTRRPDVACPNCLRPMVELDDYDPRGEHPGFSGSDATPGWSWVASLAGLIDGIAATIYLAWKVWHLRRMQRHYPDGLVCPACVTVVPLPPDG